MRMAVRKANIEVFMRLNDKLKELRVSGKLTQQEAAEYLGVSSQTVSKWERGLLSPDISLLPKIALLYRCSIDSLFDMGAVWSEAHRKEFEDTLSRLYAKKDREGVFQAWIHEIDLHPDCFSDYPIFMRWVNREKMFDDARVEKMLGLAEYAEKNCMDDDIRNEIFRMMLLICAGSDTPRFKEKAQYYYQKLPMLTHSREVYCRYVLCDEQYHAQVKQNIFHSIDICECAVRQLVLEEMPLEEQLYYYKKAAALYEIVLDDKYGGLYDVPLTQDYNKIADLLVELGQMDQAEMYVDRIISVIERHLSGEEKKNTSKLLSEDAFLQRKHLEKGLYLILYAMLQNKNFVSFRDKIAQISQKYYEASK